MAKKILENVMFSALPFRAVRIMEKLFKAICWSMGAIPARQQVWDSDDVAFWDRMLVVYGLKYLKTAFSLGFKTFEEFYKGLTYHEIGHATRVWGVPGTFHNMVIDNIFVDKLVQKKWSRDQVHQFLNIVYDTVIDTLRAWQYNSCPLVVYDVIREHEKTSGKEVNPIHQPGYTPGRKKVGEWLWAFRLAVAKQPIPEEIICPEVAEAAKQSLVIVRRYKDRKRAQEMVELLYPLFKEEFEKEFEQLKQMLEAMKAAASMATEEGGDVGKMLEGLVEQDEETKRVAGELIGQMCPGVKVNWTCQQLYEQAGKNVRFQMPFTDRAAGEKMRIGNRSWEPGMSMKDLDLRRTLRKHGVFIPGKTTVRPLVQEGPGQPLPGPAPQRMIVNTDVSGSMLNTPTTLAMFTMIRDAERRRIPIAAHLFADRIVDFDFTTDYWRLCQDIHKKYGTAGGGNSVAGLEKIENIAKSGDLLIYTTDFGLMSRDQQEATRILHKLKAMGVRIVFIAMFDHDAAKAGVNYVECRDINDLADITLTAI